MGLTGAVMAQTPTNDSTSRVLGDNPRQHRSGERNILGAPVYYDTLGNRLGETHATDSLYRRPKHHYMNRLESEFHSFFLEYSTLFTSYDVAIGAKLSYVPQRWGFYGSLMAGINHAYVTLGPVLRLSDCGDIVDWHLYGGFHIKDPSKYLQKNKNLKQSKISCSGRLPSVRLQLPLGALLDF